MPRQRRWRTSKSTSKEDRYGEEQEIVETTRETSPNVVNVQVALEWLRVLKCPISVPGDVSHILRTGAIHLRLVFPEKRWISELLASCTAPADIIPWSRHHIGNNSGAPVIQEIVARLVHIFRVNRVIETRVNTYTSKNSFKPHHQDKNAFSFTAGNVTVGASFGAVRNLEFRDLYSDLCVCFEQESGDVFAFGDEVNRRFTHGVPPDDTMVSANPSNDLRWSVVLWGVSDDPIPNAAGSTFAIDWTGSGEEAHEHAGHVC